MPPVTARPVGQSNGDMVTEFTDTAITTATTYTFSSEQNAITFSNKGVSAITVTVGGAPNVVQPGTIWESEVSFTAIIVQSSAGVQAFTVRTTVNAVDYGKSAIAAASARGYGGKVGVPVFILHTEDPTNMVKTLVRRGFTPIFLSQYYAWLQGETNLPTKPCVITVDDGRKAFFTVMHPVFQAYNVKVNAFIPSDYQYGNPVDSTLPAGDQTGWANLRTMHATGLYEWHNHSQTHANLANQTSAVRVAEFNACNTAIMNELQVPKPLAIAYPNGIWDGAIIADAKTAGLKMGFDYSSGTNSATRRFSVPGDHLFRLNRNYDATQDCILQCFDDTIYDCANDCVNQKNANNALGYWTFSGANVAFESNGVGISIDSRSSTVYQSAQSADYFRVNPTDVIYTKFRMHSQLQTAGSAGVQLAQYDKSKAFISDLDVMVFKAATGNYTTYEVETTLDPKCRYIRPKIFADAAYDGIIHAWAGLISRIA